jgi:hypothetical protein
VKTLAATVVLLAIAAPAMAQPASFDGSCEFRGSVRFNPAMTSSPQPIAFPDRRARAGPRAVVR